MMKIRRNLLSLLLTAAMLLSVTQFPVCAADGTQVNSGISNIGGYDSSADGYDYVYYGTWSNENVKWRVLSMNGNGGTYSDGTNAVGSDGAMFLLSDELLGTGSNGSVYFQQNYHIYRG